MRFFARRFGCILEIEGNCGILIDRRLEVKGWIMKNIQITRREFVAAAASSLAFTYIPSGAWGANDRFYLAGIGVGGKGAGEVADLTRAGGTFVALCDVDQIRAGKTFESCAEAKRYSDFRVMLEKEKGIDAVTVSTPDHTHAVASLLAMSLGKHVYCQKPLTHSIYEARLMTRAARPLQGANADGQSGPRGRADPPRRRAGAGGRHRPGPRGARLDEPSDLAAGAKSSRRAPAPCK
jgi:hypothetical protein